MSSERLPGERVELAALAADALAVGVWLVDRAGNTCFRNETLNRLIPDIHTLRELAAALPGVPVVAYAAQVSRGGRPVAEPAALLKAVEPARLVQLRIKAGPDEIPGSAVITIEEISDRLRVERLRALAETTLALGHEVNNPLAILSGQIELLSAELDELQSEGDGEEPGAPATPALSPETGSALAAMGERVVAMREAVTRIAGVLRRMRRVAEPLGADYLPSRGVRMLDLSAGDDGARALASGEERHRRRQRRRRARKWRRGGMTRVGLVHLTPEQLELIAAIAERPDLEVVGAVHRDATATAFKIAQVLAIPTHTEVESLRAMDPDLVVVADRPLGLRREVLDLGFPSEVLTTSEATLRLGLTLESAAAPTEPFAPGIAPELPAVSRPAPNLELMLRDSMDELMAPGADSRSALARLATAWAELLGAECCAVGLLDPDAPAELRWVAGGSEAALCTAPDLTARRALAGGVPVVYVRHEGSGGGPAGDPFHEASPIRQAIAAFPLEAVSGVLWFQDVRLPAHETDERLQALRRAARRLGRVLGLWVRLHALERERTLSARAADLALAAAGAANPAEVVAKLQLAIAAALAPEAIVLHWPGSEPELVLPVPAVAPKAPEVPGTPAAIPVEHAPELLALADRLAGDTRRSGVAVCRTQLWQGREIQGLAAAIRDAHGGAVRGTLVLFRGLQPESPAPRLGPAGCGGLGTPPSACRGGPRHPSPPELGPGSGDEHAARSDRARVGARHRGQARRPLRRPASSHRARCRASGRHRSAPSGAHARHSRVRFAPGSATSTIWRSSRRGGSPSSPRTPTARAAGW